MENRVLVLHDTGCTTEHEINDQEGGFHDDLEPCEVLDFQMALDNEASLRKAYNLERERLKTRIEESLERTAKLLDTQRKMRAEQIKYIYSKPEDHEKKIRPNAKKVEKLIPPAGAMPDSEFKPLKRKVLRLPSANVSMYLKNSIGDIDEGFYSPSAVIDADVFVESLLKEFNVDTWVLPDEDCRSKDVITTWMDVIDDEDFWEGCSNERDQMVFVSSLLETE